MGITGVAFIALGIICISRPMSTLISLAWIIGLLSLISGIATLLNWFNLKGYFPQSGSILLSSILQILLGFFFLKHDLAFATILPLVFAIFLIIEGINLAIRSFDYKKIGFKLWWLSRHPEFRWSNPQYSSRYRSDSYRHRLCRCPLLNQPFRETTQ